MTKFILVVKNVRGVKPLFFLALLRYDRQIKIAFKKRI